MADTPQTTIVAAFADRGVAQQAVARLVASGVDADSVHLHEKGMKPRNAGGVVIDEYATGGFFTNFVHLLDGLLDTPRQSPSYEELVQFEGIVVSVQAIGEDRVRQVEAELSAAGAQRVRSGRGLDPA
jgi:hypothetical protein